MLGSATNVSQHRGLFLCQSTATDATTGSAAASGSSDSRACTQLSCTCLSRKASACADCKSPAQMETVLERALMCASNYACSRSMRVDAKIVSSGSQAGCRACQDGDLEDVAPLQQPLLGSTQSATLRGLPKSLKSQSGRRLSAGAPASREASDGCDGAEVLGGRLSSLAGSQASSHLLPLQLCRDSAGSWDSPCVHRIPDGPA